MALSRPLLDIASELRLRIYDLVDTDKTRPRVRITAACVTVDNNANDYRGTQDLYSLSRVCKQIHAEVEHHLYAASTLPIGILSDPGWHFKHIVKSDFDFISRFRKIELDFYCTSKSPDWTGYGSRIEEVVVKLMASGELRKCAVTAGFLFSFYDNIEQASDHVKQLRAESYSHSTKNGTSAKDRDLDFALAVAQYFKALAES